MLLTVNFGTAIRELSLGAGVLKFNCKQTSLFLISVKVMKKMLVPWLNIKLNNDLWKMLIIAQCVQRCYLYYGTHEVLPNEG